MLRNLSKLTLRRLSCGKSTCSLRNFALHFQLAFSQWPKFSTSPSCIRETFRPACKMTRAKRPSTRISRGSGSGAEGSETSPASVYRNPPHFRFGTSRALKPRCRVFFTDLQDIIQTKQETVNRTHRGSGVAHLKRPWRHVHATAGVRHHMLPMLTASENDLGPEGWRFLA